MQVKVDYPKKTQAVMTVVTTADELKAIKEHVLGHFQDRVKVPGFRAGNVPPAVLEKHVDPALLQSEFLEEAVQQLYPQAIQSQQLRPVAPPQVSLTKFVPYTTLEFTATVDVIGEVKLGDYKKLKVKKPEVKITADEIKDVLNNLATQGAEKKDIDRAAKAGDQVWIDFKGVDDKGESINGADGKDYPLLLGSNTFIPGFEDNLLGAKANEERTFTLKFPKDYGVKALASKQVTFTTQITKVQEVVEPKIDDEFASKIGPFKSLEELKADIKKELTSERERQAQRDYESEIVKQLTAKSKVDVPDALVNEQIERLLSDLRQNLVYRGMTMDEYLQAEGKTEETYRNEVLTPQATERVKASLVLAEVAEQEKVEITPEELEVRIAQFKAQYTDTKMQEELNKPEARQDIASRILTEKTLAKLVGYSEK